MNIFKKNKINLYLKNSFKHNFDRESFLEFKNLYEKNIKNSSVSIKKKSLNDRVIIMKKISPRTRIYF